MKKKKCFYFSRFIRIYRHFVYNFIFKFLVTNLIKKKVQAINNRITMHRKKINNIRKQLVERKPTTSYLQSLGSPPNI